MKLADLIAIRLSKTAIFEMAFDRKDVEARIKLKNRRRQLHSGQPHSATHRTAGTRSHL